MNIALGLFADVAMKSTVVLLGALALIALMRRSSAGLRHLVLSMAAVVVLMLPVGAVLLPAYRVSVLPVRADSSGVAVEGVRGERLAPDVGHVERISPMAEGRLRQHGASDAAVPVPWKHVEASAVVVVIWAVGAVCVSVYWLIGLVAVRRMCRGVPVVRSGRVWDEMKNAEFQLGLRRGVELRVGGMIRMPITCRTLRPRLLLPAEAAGWSADQLWSTMMHELAHVKRKDCAVQWVMNWACAMHWFNPLVWLAAVRLRIERELACDDLVLNYGATPVNYAEHLLAVARAFRGESFWRSGAIAMARPSGLRQRVAGILDNRVNRRGVSRRSILMVTVLTSVGLVSFSCVRLEVHNAGGIGSVAATQPVQKPMVQPSSRPAVMGMAQFRMPEFPTCITVLDNATGTPIEGVVIVYDNRSVIPEFVTDERGVRVVYKIAGTETHILTDSKGQARFTFRGTSEVGMTLARDRYIGKLINWHYRAGSSGNKGGPPKEYTVRLDPAGSIGGKVLDDAGQPIAGANVEIYINGTSSDDGKMFVERPWINRAVQTEADGSWHFDRVPPEAKSVKVAAWDYRHLDGNYFFLREYEPQAVLREGKAVLTLKRGVAVRGKVLDPYFGKPIGGAKVTIGTDQSASNSIPALTVDADGGFSLGVQPGSKLVLTVTAPGYKPEVRQEVVGDQAIDLEFDLTPVRVQ